MPWKEAFEEIMADSYDAWLTASVTVLKHTELLIKLFGSAEGVFFAPKDKIQALSFLSDTEREKLTAKDREETRCSIYDYICKNDISMLKRGEKGYPKRFDCLQDKPYLIFVQGRLPGEDQPAIAIVGSRRASVYGENSAAYFSEALSKRGVSIISGLAMGIDGVAHKNALGNPGGTLGILGSGIGNPYPKENWQLYRSMRELGGILSEYGPLVPPLKQHFPHRNRLISAMADGVLVIEASEKSGTLITVDRGLEQGKEIYALPGRISDRNSYGCNNLIKQGARLVTEPEEILEDLSAIYPGFFANSQASCQLSFDFSNDITLMDELSKNSTNCDFTLARDEKVVYSLCRLDEKHFDVLMLESGLSVPKLSAALYSLEAKGLVRQSIPSHYARVRG